MTIELTDKQLKTLAHLRKCADNQLINIPLLKTFLDGLEQKAAPPVRKRKKVTRKSLYHSMLENNIHGNHRKKIV